MYIVHEFSLCEGILKQVAKANSNQLVNIDEVIVEIGGLANVDIDSLCFWFPVVAKNMFCPQIKLLVNQIDGLAQCENCQHQFKLKNLATKCLQCNEFGHFTIIQGQELLVKSFRLI